MIRQVSESQIRFYKDFIMGRDKFNPQDFGVNMDRNEFDDLLVDAFNSTYRGQWTIDELCLHPNEALQFCNGIKRQHGWFDLPDDIILRTIMNRRKHG